MVDNQLGVSLSASNPLEVTKVIFSDSVVYGEPTINNDCPGDLDQYCYCPSHKGGFMSVGSNLGGKPIHITAASALPMHKVKSEGAWAGQAFI